MCISRPVLASLLLISIPFAGILSAQEPPDYLIRRFGTSALRHGSRVQTLVFHADDKLLAGGGNDPVRLWDLETGKALRTYPEPWTQALASNSKGDRFVTAGAFRSIRTRSNLDGKETLVKHDNMPGAVRAIALSPDGKHLFAGCQNGHLVHVADGIVGTPIAEHQAEVNAVAWSADGSVVVSAAADRTIRLWKLEGDALFQGLRIKTPAIVHAVALSPNGRYLFEASDDRVIRIRDLQAETIVHKFEGHEDTIVSLALRADGKLLVSGSYDGTIRVWDVDKRALIRTIDRRFGDSDALALSPNGKLIATAGDNHTIRLFETDTGKERILSPGPESGLARMVVSPKSLLAMTRTGKVHAWNRESGQPLPSWTTRTTPRVQQEFLLAEHPDGKLLLTGSSTEPALELWDPAGKTLGTLPLPAGESARCAAFNPTGSVLAIGCRSGLVQSLDWPEKTVRNSSQAGGPVTALVFSGASPVLAAVVGPRVVLFDVPTGQELRRIASKSDVPENSLPSIADLAFSPDERTMALAGYDGVVRLLDWTTGKHGVECDGHTSAVLRVVFSPDGRRFATSSHDKTVRLWETFLGKPIAVFKGHEGPVPALAFGADGRALYSASADTTVAAWDSTCSSAGGALMPGVLTDDEVRVCWQDLASETPLVGTRALWKLVASKRSVDPIGKLLYLVDPAKVDQMFVDLNALEYVVREKATQELKRYGRWMEGRLETALVDPPTVEVKRRIESLLSLLRTKEAMTLRQERLRMMRIFTLLEQVGDDNSRRVLDQLVRGAPESELQKEAEQSLARVRRQ